MKQETDGAGRAPGEAWAWWGDERGAAAVEFALLAPLMLLLGLAGVDIARAAQAALAAEAEARALLSAIVRATAVPAPDPLPGAGGGGRNSGAAGALPALPMPAVAAGNARVRLFWACPATARDPAGGAGAVLAQSGNIPAGGGRAAGLPARLEDSAAPRCADGSRPGPHVEVEVAPAAPSLTGWSALSTLAGGSARAIARLG